MQIVVNGAPRETSARCVAELVVEVLAGVSADGVAVAVRDDVVRRSEWPTRVLSEGDRIEIIRAVGGG